MINIFIAMIVAIYSFQVFSLTYQVSGIKRTVINIPMEIFENSIPFMEQENNKFVGYFDKEILESLLSNYFDDNLIKYTDKYEIKYFYYQTSDGLFCKGDYCDGIKVNVKANIIFSFTIEQKMFYEIKEVVKK